MKSGSDGIMLTAAKCGQQSADDADRKPDETITSRAPAKPVQSTKPPEALLTRKELAGYISNELGRPMSFSTLTKLCALGEGPPVYEWGALPALSAAGWQSMGRRPGPQGAGAVLCRRAGAQAERCGGRAQRGRGRIKRRRPARTGASTVSYLAEY